MPRRAPTGKFATVDDDLTGWENPTLLARLAGLAARTPTSELLAAFRHGNPHPVRSTPSRECGLDPPSRARVWEIATTTPAGNLTTTTKSNWWSYNMALGFVASLLVYGVLLMQARTPSQQSD